MQRVNYDYYDQNSFVKSSEIALELQILIFTHAYKKLLVRSRIAS